MRAPDGVFEGCIDVPRSAPLRPSTGGITRRAFVSAALASGVALGHGLRAQGPAADDAEQWGTFEIAERGAPPTATGTPGVGLRAVFDGEGTRFVVPGFWDGEGAWRVRFMPPAPGRWAWRLEREGQELRRGEVRVRPAGAGNHGPVRVARTHHFDHADGTPFRLIGTTCYLWIYQDAARRAATLRTLSASPFNKVRMLVLPNAPIAATQPFPFVRTAAGLDYDRPDPAFYRGLEQHVAQLRDLGVEADLILFHPYDKGRGASAMTPAQREAYVRHVVARFAAFRNVWWSLANEWDLVEGMTETEFDRLFQVVRDADPYGHLRSIHNYRSLYDHRQPWVTHASIQNGAAAEDDARAVLYRDVYRKPVVFDEMRYEGDLDQRWGNLSPEQMVSGCWHLHLAGCYAGHGEAYRAQAWIDGGGELVGQSAARLAFLRRVMEDGPAPGIDPIDHWWGRHIAGAPGHYYLRYFGADAPATWHIDVPRDGLSGGERFRVDVLDTWNMTVTPVEGGCTLAQTGPYGFGDPTRPVVTLPGRPWMAVRMARAV